MVASVRSTDSWGIFACLASGFEYGCCAGSGSGGGVAGHGLEVKSELADVIRGLVNGEGASSRAGGSVAAGVSRVPDVGVVGGYSGAAGGGGDHAAHSEPCGTVSSRRSSSGGAL